MKRKFSKDEHKQLPLLQNFSLHFKDRHQAVNLEAACYINAGELFAVKLCNAHFRLRREGVPFCISYAQNFFKGHSDPNAVLINTEFKRKLNVCNLPCKREDSRNQTQTARILL